MAAKITSVNKAPMIIVPGSNDKVTQSKTDGIGSRRMTLPRDLLFRIQAEEAFDWMWEDNSSIEMFLNLNPQFDTRFYDPVSVRTTKVKLIMNKDGGLWDYHTMKFIGVSKSKML